MKNLDRYMKSLYTDISIKDCAKRLNSDKKLTSVSQSAGNLLLDDFETVQVQIVITRNGDDFIGDFETVEETLYKKAETDAS